MFGKKQTYDINSVIEDNQIMYVNYYCFYLLAPDAEMLQWKDPERTCRQMRSSLNHVDYADTDLERDDREWTQSNVIMKTLMHRNSGTFFEYEQWVIFSCRVTSY